MLVAALAFIAAATLVPAPGDTWQRDFWCVRCGGSYDPLELVLNVLLFVPFGLALRAAGARWGSALAAILVTTASIEALQYTIIVGRDGSIRDILSNMLGGLAGFAALPHAGAVWRADRKPSRRLGWAAALLWIGHAAMASLLFRPSATPYRYFSQVAPVLGQFGVFSGTVLSARLDGALVESNELDPTLETRVRAADSIALGATLIPGAPAGRLAPIVNVADGAANEIAMLGQQRHAAVFQARVRAQDLGFYAPAVVMNDVFPATPRGTFPPPMLVVGSRRGYTLHLAVTDAASRTREGRLTLSPDLGWTLWWPRDFPGHASLIWGTAAWVLVSIALIGFWSGGIAAALVAAVGAEIVVPLALGPGEIAWPNAVIAGMGVMAGLAAARLRSAGGDETLGTSQADLARAQ
jgi:VanZ like protein